MKHKTIAEFTLEVNDLARKDASKCVGLFRGVHYDYPERMMDSYFKDGHSPRQTIESITQEAMEEQRAEARMS